MNMKKGFTLIEIIISIFILAVAISIILDMNREITKNLMYSIEQVNDFSNINSMYGVLFQKAYDENNTLKDNYIYSLKNNGIKILQIERTGKKELNNNEYRKGTLEYTTSNIGPDANETNYILYDDVDDFNGYNNENLQVEVYYSNDENTIQYDKNKGEYNITYNYEKAIKPLEQGNNIKTINVTYNQSSGQKITFHYNIYNIGSSKLLSLKNILNIKPIY